MFYPKKQLNNKKYFKKWAREKIRIPGYVRSAYWAERRSIRVARQPCCVAEKNKGGSATKEDGRELIKSVAVSQSYGKGKIKTGRVYCRPKQRFAKSRIASHAFGDQ